MSQTAAENAPMGQLPNSEGLEKLDILVLMGGLSEESKISIKSGKAVVQALKTEGLNVRGFDLTSISGLMEELSRRRPNCVFNALHGGFGEDGHIPALLDMLEISYTHSGPLASAVAMNKPFACLVAKSCGCKTAPYDTATWASLKENGLKNLSVGPPCVIKPLDSGSTYGCIYVENDKTPLADLLPTKRPKTEPVMIETYIPGTELTVAVLNGEALACTEICFEGAIYGYDAKYVLEPKHKLPPSIPKEIEDLAMRQSEAVHAALGCHGLTRCDFRYDKSQAGPSGLVFIEINSHPGLTNVSLAPEQAAHIGRSFSELCIALICDTLARNSPSFVEPTPKEAVS